MCGEAGGREALSSFCAEARRWRRERARREASAGVRRNASSVCCSSGARACSRFVRLCNCVRCCCCYWSARAVVLQLVCACVLSLVLSRPPPPAATGRRPLPPLSPALARKPKPPKRPRARARAGAHLLAFFRVGSPLNRPPPASKKLALHTCTVGFAYVCRRDSPPSQWITLPVVNGSSVGDMTVATVRATSSAVTRRCGG